MDVSTVLAVVQTILTAIQTLCQIQPLCSFSNCKRELEDLQKTVRTVQAVLEDAEAKQDWLNSQDKDFILELKDAVYDADDVMDEFLTLAKQKELTEAGDNKVSDKVKSLLSRFKFLTHNLSGKVKKVNAKLDAIATKRSKFSLEVENKPVMFSKADTSSFLGDDEIIGREEDVEKIVDMLLCDKIIGREKDVDLPDVSFVAIVGMGGLGKTALAQLVYNDPRITNAFQLKCWTCIADQDQGRWNVTELLGKVLRELNGRTHDLTTLEQMHPEVRKQLGGKKYLLVLDDVWTESSDRWQEFAKFLKVGLRGSRIVVTTRSKTTAEKVGRGQGQVHELQGLSETKSWHLFEKMAFLPDQRDDDFVKLGKKIVEKCSNVPLAIRVVASLLQGQRKNTWLSFHDNELAKISQSNDTMRSMTNILKISYHQLKPALKTCFAYCAIFPKDWVINKNLLIQLWMAQGFINIEDVAQGFINIEDVGEEYFLTLLQRCFFQDVCEEDGEISFKMHDLLHDIAEQVAGDEICRFTSNTVNVGKRVRHVSHFYYYQPREINKTHIRTYLTLDSTSFTNEKLKLLRQWTCLRSLDLRGLGVENLPESLGNLLHLRFLNLAGCTKLKVLPKAITKLVNLQSLNLKWCVALKELPNKVNKLANLRILNLTHCNALSRMPSDIGMLTSLHTLLGKFVVGVRESKGAKQCFDGLEGLEPLNNLKGKLRIEVGVLKTAKYVKEEHGGGGYLRMKEHLKKIVINFGTTEEYGSMAGEQALLEEMQPHPNLMKLKLEGYHGETLPRWPRGGDNSPLFDLPNLVGLNLYKCSELLSLPGEVGKLPHLKTLRIRHVKNMQYFVNANPGGESSFFPSLNELSLISLDNLQGWWQQFGLEPQVVNSSKDDSSQEPHLGRVSSLCFLQLRQLLIHDCPKLTHIPTCPRFKVLQIIDFDNRERGKTLTLKKMRLIPCHDPSLSRPMIMTIKNVEYLRSMSIPTEYFQRVAAIDLLVDNTTECLVELTEFTHFCSPIRFLRIRCRMLRSLGGWMEHLSALEYLDIEECPNLVLAQIPWQHLSRSLKCLTLYRISELEELPEGIQYCTSLESLKLVVLPKLKSLPKWMPKLVSLQKLQLLNCSEMVKERCQQPDGLDWPLIQHIQHSFLEVSCFVTEAQKTKAYEWMHEDDWIY